jgi:hypothetical protein
MIPGDDIMPEIKHMGWNVLAPSGNATFGIVVGTGSTTVTNDDFKLQTQIAHGNGAGQLQHLATTVEGVTVAGNVTTLTVKRLVTNASGSNITVNEVGLIVQTYSTSDLRTTNSLVMIARDVISGGAVILNGATVPIYIYVRVTA